MTNFNRVHGLRILADVLEEKEKDDFDSRGFSGFSMDNWIRQVSVLPEGVKDATLKAGVSPRSCGTALCVAGFAAIEAGWTVKYQTLINHHGFNYVTKTSYRPDGTKHYDEIPWERAGREYLGMDPAEAGILFMSVKGNQAIEILERLCAGEDIPRKDWEGYVKAGDIDMEAYEEWNECSEECFCRININ